MKGKRIAVFGLGRSGLAIGRAAVRLGGFPVVFDQKTAEALPKPELADEADSEGIGLALGWSGGVDGLAQGWDGSIPDMLVANPAVPKEHPLLQGAVAAGIPVWSEVEFAYRISKAPIVAITGTNGKSTTTVMTYLCLKACREDPVLCGNIFGSGYPEVPMTEAALNATSDQVLVAEISSFQLEWVDQFRPAAAGITNISPDHLDRYTGFEEYAETKQRLFRRMEASDTAVIREGDPVVRMPQGPMVLTFGPKSQHASFDGNRLLLLDKHVAISDLPFREPHNFLNAGMAALLTFGVLRHKTGQDDLSMPDGVIDGLREFRGLAHRMEAVGQKDGVLVINNSMCTNPDAVVYSAQASPGRTHLLIGGTNKKLNFEPLKIYLSKSAHQAYLFGTDAADLAQMLSGSYPIFSTLKDAFDAATRAATAGEVVMLAPGCASTDQFRDFRDRGDVFKAIAKEWLRS